MRYFHSRREIIKDLQEGKADAGLLFVIGMFFLTLAFVVVYFSYFGLTPLPRSNKAEEMPAAAVLSFPEPAPVSIETADPNKTETDRFFASLSGTAVKEIFIGSYGVADKDILEELRTGVEKTFGVKTTLLNPGPTVPKQEPFYDKTRDQYNSDVLLKSIEQSSSAYGQTVRFLYVVDLRLASFSEWSPQEEWLRADSGANAGLISLHAFHVHAGSGKEAPRGIFLGRAKKAALRALGMTVGFDFSPSAADAFCLMHPSLSVEELDAQKSELCSPESEAVKLVFKGQFFK